MKKTKNKPLSKKKRSLDISLQHKNRASNKFSKKNFCTWPIIGLALKVLSFVDECLIWDKWRRYGLGDIRNILHLGFPCPPHHSKDSLIYEDNGTGRSWSSFRQEQYSHYSRYCNDQILGQLWVTNFSQEVMSCHLLSHGRSCGESKKGMKTCLNLLFPVLYKTSSLNRYIYQHIQTISFSYKNKRSNYSQLI